MPAATQGIVLARRPLSPSDRTAALIGERDPARDPIWAVPGHLHSGLARAVTVDGVASLDAVERVAERPRGAVPNRSDDLVHPPATRRDERLLVDAEDRRQAVGAVARVLTRAAVVEDRDLLPNMGVEPVAHP